MMIASLRGSARAGLKFSAVAILSLTLLAGADSAWAACAPGAASPQKVADFTANPSSLLGSAGTPRTPQDVTNDIRDLVTSDPATLPLVISLLKSDPAPSSEIQRAIGSGLGLAANTCVRPDPTFAGEIQTQIAATNSADAKQQYAAITGNLLIGSVGGGAGGAGSSGASGGQTNPLTNQGSGGSSALQTFLANSVTNPTTNYFSGSTTGLSTSTSTTTTITSVSTSTP